MDFKDYEDKTLRKVRRITIGRILTRTYNIPVDAIDGYETGASSTFERGDLMPGEADTLLAPRVKNVFYGQPRNASEVQLIVEWIQPIAHADSQS